MVFVCSPVADEEKKLVSLAKKMKKGNIDVDFILFGEIDDDVQKKLEAFNNVVKSPDSSHFIVAPADGRLLSDQLLSTPILLGEAAAAGGAGGGGGGGDFGDFGDFDPNNDPELALALRMSMEEENARQAREAQANEDASKKSNLEGIQEEDEAQPLLSQQGEASGSGSGDGSGNGSSGNKKDDSKDGGDKMDTS